MAFFARFAAMVLLPLTDPTEGRYAQVSQEMAVTGDWVTPRIWMNEVHLPFMGKPPLFFWSAAGAMKLFGENEFAARLPSLVATLLVARSALRRVGTLRGRLRFCKRSDNGLVRFLLCGERCGGGRHVARGLRAGNLLAYFAFTCEPSRQIRGSWSLLVFFLLALGFLTKGPVAVVLFRASVFVWTSAGGSGSRFAITDG
jgi:4-amino-4-deoxy-L-arabinose transferase-like glycosyltransferase